MHGHTTWFFPDGDLPPPGDIEPKGHESLLILNPNANEFEITLTFYYDDRAPVEVSPGCVEGERVHCLRLDGPLGAAGYRVPYGQYAIRVDATVPVICQIGRMDVRQPNLAYYTVMGQPG